MQMYQQVGPAQFSAMIGQFRTLFRQHRPAVRRTASRLCRSHLPQAPRVLEPYRHGACHRPVQCRRTGRRDHDRRLDSRRPSLDSARHDRRVPGQGHWRRARGGRRQPDRLASHRQPGGAGGRLRRRQAGIPAPRSPCTSARPDRQGVPAVLSAGWRRPGGQLYSRSHEQTTETGMNPPQPRLIDNGNGHPLVSSLVPACRGARAAIS